jgi:putative ABC transport system permease protein
MKYIRAITNLLKLAWLQLTRHRVRSILTIFGVASGMFLFTAVETLQRSLGKATEATAADTTLVVYRQNRFCPSASRLPEHYADEIRRIDGVREVVPVQIVVNNCGASLDVITYRGVPEGMLKKFAPEIEIIAGSEAEWSRRDDGALLGEIFAQRRGLKPGDRFDAAGITVTVSGVIRSPFAQDNNVAYVKLPFLQQASRGGLGVVTQFNVRVNASADLDPVASKIDELFSSAQEPTDTRPEKAFFAETAAQLIELIGFTRWLGVGAVIAVAGLVANALLLVVRGRVKENAVLRTLGFPGRAIGLLVLSEGGLLGLAGGVVGVGLAVLFLRWQSFTMGNEGQTLAIQPDATVVIVGVGSALVLGIFASLWPAFQAMSQPIVKNLRS